MRSYILKEGMRLRSAEEGRRLQVKRELERVRKNIRINVPELLKDLNIERTKDGRIKVRSQPPEVRNRFKEALRLREQGKWGVTIVAKALGLPDGTVHAWYFRSPEANRKQSLRWWRKHRKEVSERLRRKRGEARKDLIGELGGRCQRCRETINDPNSADFHELEKAKEDMRKSFLDTSLGRKWIRYRKTKHREEALGEMREKVVLLDVKCHRKITAEERRLNRRFSREEILTS